MKSFIILIAVITLSLLSVPLASGTIIFQDDFSSGNLNNWTIYTQNWDVVNGEMHGWNAEPDISPNTGNLSSYTLTGKARYRSGLGWRIEFIYLDPNNKIGLWYAVGAPDALDLNIYVSGTVSTVHLGTCSQWGTYADHYYKFVVNRTTGNYEVWFGNDPNNLTLLNTGTIPVSFQSSNTIRYHGWGYAGTVQCYFDNVVIETPNIIFQDDFSSGNLNNWTIYTQNWDVVNGEMHGWNAEPDISPNTGNLSSYILTGKARYGSGLGWRIEFIYLDPNNKIGLWYAVGAPDALDLNIYVNAMVSTVHLGTCSQWGTNADHYYKFVVNRTTGNYEVWFGNDPNNLTLLNTGTIPVSFQSSNTIRYHGWGYAGTVQCYFDNVVIEAPAQLDVTLTPINPPIVIPAQGGSFQFSASVINHGPNQVPFRVWARILGPGGAYLLDPSLGPVQINPPVNITVSRLRTQNVPGIWPAGGYTYLGYANWTYSYPAIDSSWFTFTKLVTSGNGPTVWDATCSGEPFPGEVMQAAEIHPSAFSLHPCSPNPFNPTTSLSFELRASSFVSLKVYDTAGRLVSTLEEGWREVGTHKVIFDGSTLASGVYLYTLTAGQQSASGKMLLLK